MKLEDANKALLVATAPPSAVMTTTPSSAVPIEATPPSAVPVATAPPSAVPMAVAKTCVVCFCLCGAQRNTNNGYHRCCDDTNQQHTSVGVEFGIGIYL